MSDPAVESDTSAELSDPVVESADPSDVPGSDAELASEREHEDAPEGGALDPMNAPAE
jgi:hypothetical protein